MPDGVKLVADDLEEVTIATLSPPRVEEEPEPDVEEETELVGEDGEPPEGEDGAGESAGGDDSGGGIRRGLAPVALPPPRLRSRRATGS